MEPPPLEGNTSIPRWGAHPWTKEQWSSLFGGCLRSSRDSGDSIDPHRAQPWLAHCHRILNTTTLEKIGVKECGSVLAWGCGVFSATGEEQRGASQNWVGIQGKMTDEVAVPAPIPMCAQESLWEESTGRVLTFGDAVLGWLDWTPVGNLTNSSQFLVDSALTLMETTNGCSGIVGGDC